MKYLAKVRNKYIENQDMMLDEETVTVTVIFLDNK